ncbi:MAG TPA: GIDE domain-containing protein [Terriglobales bacterium]|nr:GIDE domain-containing protein [Terriglobales bacterium]
MIVTAAAAAWHRADRPSDLVSALANPLIWSVIGFAAGIYFFFRGFALLQRKRFIENVPRSTVRGASLGLIEVSGKVEGPYTIVAPLSEEDCFFYRTIAWTGDRRSWRKAAEENLSAPFFLDDGTGKLMVDARGANSELEAAFSEEYEGGVPEYAQHFLNRHGVSHSPVRLEEYVVRPGQTLFAMGTLRENPEKKSDGSSQFLSAEAAELQSEQEIGGVILPGAAAARPKLSAKTSEEFDLSPAVVLRGAPNRPLFISARSQREIIQVLAWQSAFCIWGGPILTLVCFWYLLERLALK